MATLLASLLFGLLSMASLTVWWRILGKWRNGEPPLAYRDDRPRRWHWPAVAMAAIWVLLQVQGRIALELADKPPEPVDLDGVQLQAGIQCLLIALLLSPLAWQRRPLTEFGIDAANLPEQAWDGVLGFVAAFAPVWLVLIATSAFRDPELQHGYLRFLQENKNLVTVAWVALSAVVLASLAEELTFRVILQGALERFIPPAWAIGVVAVLFCLVHGWQDSLPLLPLAFVLGYVFHRRHSYVAVVVLHACFNGSMLALQLLTTDAPAL